MLRSLVALNIRHGITFKGLISLQSQPPLADPRPLRVAEYAPILAAGVT